MRCTGRDSARAQRICRSLSVGWLMSSARSACPVAAMLMTLSVAYGGTAGLQLPSRAFRQVAPSGDSAKQGPIKPSDPSDPSGGAGSSASPQAAAKPDVSSGASQPKPPKSLDELLGVPSTGSSGSSAESAAEREQARRLERALDEASLEDLVERAVEGMRSASERLEDARDPGIGTQRIQEDVVRTLARLLEEAERQSQSKSKSSSSRQSGSRRNSSEDPSERNGQQSSQRDDRSARAASETQPGDNDGESTRDRPADQVTADGVELEESRIEWGQLPERVRELVLQGRRDRVSSIYERLTREYYRRLAEEASK